MNPFSICTKLRPLILSRSAPTLNHVSSLLPTGARLQRIAVAPVQLRHKQTFSRTQMPSRPKPPSDDEIEESFLKGSGPGGQKINKTNSAVQLKHIPTGIVVKCQETRSRTQNRKIARQLLADKLDLLYNGENSRQVIVGGVKKKRADSAAKKSRRKYKKLAEEKANVTGEEQEQEGEQEDDDIDQTPDPRPEPLETHPENTVKLETVDYAIDDSQDTKRIV
ncbi:RF-1 domain-containing protein [Podospora australis]|uniref:RF-1 domain-containing protein n=1 Tax=Podospora australis TaxID=1536484 RepID=A0AAN6X138_9PEZI|nr:RF-1 domain-containing protein [Podospora australis]